MMNLPRAVLASFAQAQLEAAVDSYRRQPGRDALRDLTRAVARYERYQAVVRERGCGHIVTPFRASQR